MAGGTFYYNTGLKYIHVSENLAYQIFLYAVVALVIGVLTLLFINVWISNSHVAIKVIKNIVLWFGECLIVLSIVAVNSYGTNLGSIIKDMSGGTYCDWIELWRILIFFIVVLNYFGIVTMFTYWRNCKKEKKRK